jgi:flagella basal body P-ring formation protein FlgA
MKLHSTSPAICCHGIRRMVLACLSLASAAHASQDAAMVQAQAYRYLQSQTASLSGQIKIDVRPPRASLPDCAALEAFQPVGSRNTGKTLVGVRCLAPAPWTVYLPAVVQVFSHYVVTRQALPAQHALSAADLMLREGDIGSLPADIARDPAAVTGFRTVSGLAAGAALRSSLLRAPLVVQQGQPTRLIMNGPGFSVQSEGQALANGSKGERVRVKTLSGQVVSGVAQEGQQVVIAY